MSITVIDSNDAGVTAKGLVAAGNISVPAWWTQWHSWVFAGFVVANVAVAWPILRSLIRFQDNATGLWADAVQSGMIGLCIGQLYLASLWLAFGGLSTLLRFAMVLLAVLLGAINAAIGIGEDWGMVMTICIGVSLLIVLLSQLVLAPVRWLTGWRIDFDSAYHAAEAGGRMQLRLWHYLALIFLATLPLVVYRTMDAIAPNDDAAGLATTAALLAAMTVFVAAPVTWLILSKHRNFIAWLAPPLGLILAGALGYVATVAMRSEQAQSPSELVFLLLLPLGALVPVALNLLILRMVGLHLFSTKCCEIGTRMPAVR
ncbi:MAG TPA: hypothetical protein VFB96_00240 [Pirellulaceae bacterium]|nr:hypothetical protein [Pirellulaceae bacterium]